MWCAAHIFLLNFLYFFFYSLTSGKYPNWAEYARRGKNVLFSIVGWWDHTIQIDQRYTFHLYLCICVDIYSHIYVHIQLSICIYIYIYICKARISELKPSVHYWRDIRGFSGGGFLIIGIFYVTIQMRVKDIARAGNLGKTDQDWRIKRIEKKKQDRIKEQKETGLEKIT